MSSAAILLGLASPFEYAPTGERFVVRGESLSELQFIPLEDLPSDERAQVEREIEQQGITVYDDEGLALCGIRAIRE